MPRTKITLSRTQHLLLNTSLMKHLSASNAPKLSPASSAMPKYGKYKVVDTSCTAIGHHLLEVPGLPLASTVHITKMTGNVYVVRPCVGPYCTWSRLMRAYLEDGKLMVTVHDVSKEGDNLSLTLDFHRDRELDGPSYFTVGTVLKLGDSDNLMPPHKRKHTTLANTIEKKLKTTK